MLTVAMLLVAMAVVFVIANAMGRIVLWPAVLCLALERILAILD